MTKYNKAAAGNHKL